jgi:hypothetical protein
MRSPVHAGSAHIPRLKFSVQNAESLEYVAVPTLKFALAIATAADQPIRAVLLDVQIQIAARQRGYSSAEGHRLLELFGTPDRWATTQRTLPWTRTTLVVPSFSGHVTVDLLIPCTYDFEVTAARYLAALDDGEIPLELLFSGSLFYTAATGALQTARIAWDQELAYRLPVQVWRETMDRHFPGTAWLRLGKDSFNRLCSYKARHAFESWDKAIDSLLEETGRS